MRILGVRWQDGYLDPHRAPGELRIQVLVWWPLARMSDAYLPQSRSLRRAWNYLREIGPRELLRKVRSRHAEGLRDRVFLAVGLGRVIESDSGSGTPNAPPVVFAAPCHPECVERVCLPRECTRPIAPELADALARPDSIRLIRSDAADAPDFDAIAGWRRESSLAAPPCGPLLDWSAAALSRIDSAGIQELPASPPSAIRERSSPSKQTDAGDLSAVVFGLGHYAKTCILPNLHPRIRVTCIHEIDPTQIGRTPADGRAYDTAPQARHDERYDVHIIAGYHHSHAAQAIHALGQGAVALVEKPLCIMRSQLAELLEAVAQHPGRLFGCFPLRYLPFWPLARRDLGVSSADPINFHCLVYEVPLVRRHWYNWPVSRSRIVSNGCHWIDAFLFLNNYSAPHRTELFRTRRGDLHASVELENGASFSMVLTDHGSPRIGLQDHIELRAARSTVRIDNFCRYQSEDARRVIRQARIRKGGEARRMFCELSRRVLAGEPGDSLDSIRCGADLMLTLDELAHRPITARAR